VSIKGDILQAIRAWLMLASDRSTPLEDAKVVLFAKRGPRTALPYLAVNCTISGQPHGMDEELWLKDEDDEEAGLHQPRGIRRYVVSIHGFGEAAGEWLAEAVAAMTALDVQAIFDEAACSVLVLSGPTEVEVPLETTFEERYLVELEVYTMLLPEADPTVALDKAEISATFTREATTPADLESEFTA
jgi:hypothetical protein